MKKKLVVALLMTAIMTTTLAGCGKNETPAVVNSTVTCIDNTTNIMAEYDPVAEAEYPAAYDETFVAKEGVEGCEPSIVFSNEFASDLDIHLDYGNETAFNTEEYSKLEENGFKNVSLSPLSTFSADVDTASYSNVRRFISYGYTLDEIPRGSVRTEEFINYFDYDYKLPEKGQPFAVTTELGDCPWNKNSKLLSVGIKTSKIDFSEAPASNIVFLIDVSGSMSDDNKLPLLVNSFKMMLEELSEKDLVSIVTYAGSDSVVLDGVKASKKKKITNALDGLMASGSTNGGQGIITAYKIAEDNFIKGGNNRVILATDGDLNVGITSESDLKDLIEKERESGVYLTTLGFGTGNYSDTRLETLADCGNGNYSYIDSLSEAKKVLCEELGATMVTVAKDVKFQVEFNPRVVAQYRLIGYENRLMNAEDFKDDTKDAGEIGAGHTVTALYEIVTVDDYDDDDIELKYQKSNTNRSIYYQDEWATVSIRYKNPNEDKSNLLEYPIKTSDYQKKNSNDFLWAATVAEFAQVLRQESYVEDSDLGTILDRLADLDLDDEYKEDFKAMVKELRRN